MMVQRCVKEGDVWLDKKCWPVVGSWHTCHHAFKSNTIMPDDWLATWPSDRELRCYNQTSCLMFNLLDSTSRRELFNWIWIYLDQQLTEVCQLNVAKSTTTNCLKLRWLDTVFGWKLKLIWSNVDESHWLDYLCLHSLLYSVSIQMFQQFRLNRNVEQKTSQFSIDWLTGQAKRTLLF